MNSQPPNDNGFLQLLEKIQQKIVDYIRRRDWPKLLLLIVVILFVCFGPSITPGITPGIGFIISLISKEPPTWYWIVFFLTEGALFFASILLELRKHPARGRRLRPRREHYQWMKFFIFLVLTVALLTIALTILNELWSRQEDPTLQCEIREDKDCFSWGENILISKKNTMFNGKDDWQKKCIDYLDLKLHGTMDFEKLSQEDSTITRNFEKFVASCPNDPEAWIYLNNAKAKLAGNPIRIAVTIPISRVGGHKPSNSLQVLRGVAVAQDKINKNGGIQNRKLLIGIADEGYKVEGDGFNEREAAKKVAEFLSNNKNIVGVIGHSTSDATEEAAKIYNKQELVAISATSTAVRKIDEDPNGNADQVDLSKYVFRTAINDKLAAKELVEKAVQYQNPYIAIVYNGDSKYSRSFKKAFQNNFEDQQGKIVNKSVDKCDISKKGGFRLNPRVCLEQAKQGGAGALLLVPSAATINYIKGLVELNFENKPSLYLLGTDTMYDKNFLDEKTKDMIAIVSWHRNISPSDFEKEVKNLFPYAINWETAMAYDATQALAEGLRKASQKCFWSSLSFWDKYAQSTCLRKELKNALLDKDFKADGAAGKGSVKFDKNGDRIKADGIGVLVRVCEVKNNNQRKEFEFLQIDNNLNCNRDKKAEFDPA